MDRWIEILTLIAVLAVMVTLLLPVGYDLVVPYISLISGVIGWHLKGAWTVLMGEIQRRR